MQQHQSSTCPTQLFVCHAVGPAAWAPNCSLCFCCKDAARILAVHACSKPGATPGLRTCLACAPVHHQVSSLSLLAPPGLQVKSGVFVSSNRDAALMRMIEAAAFRYSPEREAELLQPPQEPGAAQTSAGGSLARLSASVLRKISLSSVSLSATCAAFVAKVLRHLLLCHQSWVYVCVSPRCCDVAHRAVAVDNAGPGG
jgi:hypothetical protein